MKEKRLWNLTNHRCGKIKNFPLSNLGKAKGFSLSFHNQLLFARE
jgi:hypothetical protein